MNTNLELTEGYHLSSQQCCAHVSDWQRSMPVIVALAEGPVENVSVEDLRSSLSRLTRQHEILRTCYKPVPGLLYPLQYIALALSPAWLIFENAVEDEEQLINSARSLVDLEHGPVLGVAVDISEKGKMRWALAAPSYSLDVKAIQELMMSCVTLCIEDDCLSSEMDDVLQYLDYAAWQSELFVSELGEEGCRFWEAQAINPEYQQYLLLSEDNSESVNHSVIRGLTPKANTAICHLAEHLDLPVESVVLGLWGIFIVRISQSQTVACDQYVDVRTDELDTALGHFSVKLPLAFSVNPDQPVDIVIRSIDDQLQTALSWQECFDAVAFYEQLSKEDKQNAGLEFNYLRLLQFPDGWACARVDLHPGDAHLICECIESDSSRSVRLQSTGSYSSESLNIWIDQFSTLLDRVGDDPATPVKRLPLISDAERERIFQTNRPEWQISQSVLETLHGLIEYQVELSPNAMAVVCGNEKLTYQELDLKANYIASRLVALKRKNTVKQEQIVGVYLGRSVDVIVAIFAVLKSGAAYLALDPAYPADRIDGMVSDACVTTIIMKSSDQERFADSNINLFYIDEPYQAAYSKQLIINIAPDNLAYLIYTSGSTGKPKGVMVSHANALASTAARFEFYSEELSSFLLLSSLSFDSSVAGVFWTLGQGGTLYIPSDDEYQDPTWIASVLSSEKISHVLTLPSFYSQILDQLDDDNRLYCAIVAGEPCHAELVEKHRSRAPDAVLVNEYGSTEGTVWSNAFRINVDTIVPKLIPIGSSIPSMQGYVLDEALELCPIGVPGEWYIGGAGITRGYRNRAAFTAQKFVADPFASNKRLYRTGDRVRLRHDGELEFLGRVDNQIKLRGYRIELEEIENTLLEHGSVQEAVVLAHDDEGVEQKLVAYVIAKDKTENKDQKCIEEQLLTNELSVYLRQKLPAYMIPTAIVEVLQFPIMPNGKVDRRALLALGAKKQRPPFVAPSNKIETVLANIWQDLLKVDQVGRDDNFFELGGHSLLGTRVSFKIQQELGVDIPLKMLFEKKVIRDLAASVQDELDAGLSELSLMESLVSDMENS